MKPLPTLNSEEVTEALFAVEDAPQGQADLLGLSQELGSQVGVDEGPEVVTAGPGVGDGQQGSLLAAKSLGFDYLTLDLEGFRSGSMDIL